MAAGDSRGRGKHEVYAGVQVKTIAVLLLFLCAGCTLNFDRGSRGHDAVRRALVHKHLKRHPDCLFSVPCPVHGRVQL